MLSSAELQTVLDNFRRAASEFGFDFIENIQLAEGVSAFGYIPDYGSRNGAIICLTEPSDFHTDECVWEWCEANGYFCASLNAEPLTGAYDRAYFREMLRDWRLYERAWTYDNGRG